MSNRWKWFLLKLLPLLVAYNAASSLSLTRTLFLVLGITAYGLMCGQQATEEAECL